MPPSKKQEQKLPILLFLLEHKKFHELIKFIFNEAISKKFLNEYGYQKPEISKLDQFKINQDAKDFTIEELIEIKGSISLKPKRFENIPLINTILKKLKNKDNVQPHQRKMLWLQFTQIYAQQQLYQGLEDLEIPPDTQCLLDKDIKRTYYHLATSSQQQKQRQTQGLRNSIKQSLSRFALYNPFLLYCQGMNEIFGFLYEENFNSKESFFVFKRITEVLLPSDYYSSLEGIVAYLKIFWQMISVSYPKIHQKFNSLIKEMEFSGSYLCVFSHVLQWFVCLFTNAMLDREVRIVIFDYFLLEGITIFFKASLAIFDYLQPTILSANNFQQYVIKVQEAVKTYSNINHLRKFLNQKFVSKQILLLMKQYVTNPQQIQIQNKRIIPFTKKCCKKWNFCLQQLQNNSQSQQKCDFFVFKIKPSVKIIPNYLNKLNTYYFEKKKNYKAIDLKRIGRIAHICADQSEEGTEDSLSQNNHQKKQLIQSIKFSPTSRNKQTINIKQISTPLKKEKQKDQPQVNEFRIDKNNLPNHFDTAAMNLSESNLALHDQNSIYHRKQTLQYRQKIKQKLLKQAEKKSFQRSQSMMFMKMMVDNESYSNLFSLLQNEQMDKMFEIDDESEQDSQLQSERSAKNFSLEGSRN